ncbi:glycosyltransferase 87 family protein [Nocardia sp. CDC159]|uniref:Glycosyltransferase 87 family protein n=1 Tax=Nocardia pulmonis TaxID=2951408 RepID=A0A9X2E4J8_9NOCA|nr:MULTISPECIES: glycosyltransferase 87 family protein [Nocardia]MCM6772953.1 glycosyltransferase 87 family protein [Nocardia pulmonis]MCM6785744.1 glycosyltransferase 87 family protein [Nocardia sp. CDC159]
MNDRSRVADPDELPVTNSAGPSTASPAARQRRLLGVSLALFAVSSIVLYLTKQWHGYIDLQVYRNGARVWLDGGDLYGPLPKSGGIGLPFTYPPLAALFFAPLALLPLHWAEWLVLATSIAALGATLWVLLDRLRPNLDRTTKWALVIGAVALLGLSEPVRQTYNFGQINLVLMAAVALDALVRRPFWPRGMLIGIAVSIKLIPAGFLLYFLLRVDWRAVLRGDRRVLHSAAGRAIGTLLASAVGAITLGFLLFPKDSANYWLHTMLDTGRIGPPQFAGNQSLKGFAFRLGVADSTAITIWILLSLIVVALAAVWMKRLIDDGRTVSALLVNAAAILLVSPVSWSHHWVWIAPALIVAADTIVGGARRRWFLVGTGAIVVLFMVGPQWLLPHHQDRELGWSWWQQIVGSGYVLVTLAALVIGALAYRPAGVRKAVSAAE